jgi:hypothetical protein
VDKVVKSSFMFCTMYQGLLLFNWWLWTMIGGVDMVAHDKICIYAFILIQFYVKYFIRTQYITCQSKRNIDVKKIW